MGDDYDEIPHPSTPRPETQPDRLAVIATLFGMTPAPPERCRVLDLGCSDGANLISTALALPESELVGIDLSPVQIEQGRATVAALGIENVRLEVGDLRDLPDLGTFDYVISYGLMSWVPIEVRDALLRVVRGALAPQGMAYLSSNTYPGWHFLRALREMVLYRGDPHDLNARVSRARAVMQFLASSVPESAGVYGVFLQGELRESLRMADHNLCWDLLCEVCEPLYFHELAALFERHGLQFVSESNLADFLPENHLSPEALKALPALAPDLVAREQYMDFLLNRSFRRTVVCRDDVSLQRQLAAGRLATLHVASGAGTAEPDPDLRSDAKVEFRGPKVGKLVTSHPLSKGALAYLATQWPAWVPIAELPERARAWMAERGGAPDPGPHDAEIVAEHLLVAFSRGVLELHAAPVAFTLEVGERPIANPLARRRLEQGAAATNLRHEMVALDATWEAVLPLLDGTRDRVALSAELPDLTPEALEEALREIAERALLMPQA